MPVRSVSPWLPRLLALASLLPLLSARADRLPSDDSHSAFRLRRSVTLPAPVASSPGPGSLRGMQILLDEQGKGVRATKRNWQALMDGLRPKVNASLTRGKPSMPQLCAQDLQNCLCEYSKYERCRNGDGRSKRTYQGV